MITAKLKARMFALDLVVQSLAILVAHFIYHVDFKKNLSKIFTLHINFAKVVL